MSESRQRAWRVVRDAAIVVGACAVVSGVVNAVRGGGIPFVATTPYQILVPCPETSGEATELAPAAAVTPDSRAMVIDARAVEEFARWHAPGAVNVPYDYLEQTPPNSVREVASSGARQVVVYGDGADPDSGEQLARELAGKGIRNVGFVRGGAPAVRKAGAP